MGQTLDTPEIEKRPESGRNGYLRYGFSDMQGYRKEMEDAHTIEIKETSLVTSSEYQSKVKEAFRLKELSYFGVYDGHGGTETAAFLKKHLLKFIIHYEKNRFKEASFPPMRLFDSNKYIEQCFLNVDKKWQTQLLKTESTGHVFQKPDQSGSTCNCVMVVPYKKNMLEIVCCNVGDSRCVLYNTGKVIAMSRDHKPDDPKELDRIEKAGGSVDEENRVSLKHQTEGILALSRAFGDFAFKSDRRLNPKNQIVTSLPSIIRYDLNMRDTGFADQYRFLVLACDGIWDVMRNDEVCEFVLQRLKEQEEGTYYDKRRERLRSTYREAGVGFLPALKEEIAVGGEYDLESIAEELIDECALERQSKDNMSAIVVLFSGEWEWFGNEDL